MIARQRAGMRENGLDLVAFTEKGHFGVMVAEVAVLPVKPQLWDTLTPRELRDNSQLAQMEPNKITSVPHPEDPPTDRPTVLFRTREEGLGILQVLGLSDNGTKVKIRYKMLPTAAQSADLGPVEAYTHNDPALTGRTDRRSDAIAASRSAWSPRLGTASRARTRRLSGPC